MLITKTKSKNKNKQIHRMGFGVSPTYSGKPEAPFTIKNKLFQCSPNTGKFRRTGNRQMKC
jgi:hypothetical protein